MTYVGMPMFFDTVRNLRGLYRQYFMPRRDLRPLLRPSHYLWRAISQGRSDSRERAFAVSGRFPWMPSETSSLGERTYSYLVARDTHPRLGEWGLLILRCCWLLLCKLPFSIWSMSQKLLTFGWALEPSIFSRLLVSPATAGWDQDQRLRAQ